MKKLYVLTLLFCISVYAKAQVFAPVGAEWYYTNIESYLAPNIGYEHTKVVGDTLILGKTCRNLKRVLHTTWNGAVALPNTYLHISGDTVFKYSADSTFSVLYNFGAQPGDSWILKEWEWYPTPGVVEITITVDSISMVQVNGQQLRQLNVSSDHNLLSFGYTGKIIEKLGGVNYMFLEDYAMSHDDIRVSLRCYSDSSFGNYQADASIGCSQMITSRPKDYTSFSQKTYPNPSAGAVTVDFMEQQYPKELQIYDALGRLVSTQHFAAEQTTAQVDLPTKGLYLFLTQIQGQTVFTQKVVRE